MSFYLIKNNTIKIFLVNDEAISKLRYEEGEFLSSPNKPFYLKEVMTDKSSTPTPDNTSTTRSKSQPKGSALNLISQHTSYIPKSSSESSSSSSTCAVATPQTDLFLKEIYEELQREKSQTTTTKPKPKMRTLNLTSQRNPPEPQKAAAAQKQQPSTFYNEHTYSSQRMPAIEKLLSKLSKSSDSYQLQEQLDELPLHSSTDKEQRTEKKTWESTSTSSSNIKSMTGFRLADFRREFKRSVNDLNKNLSKSINALDYIGKHMTLTQTEDGEIIGNGFMSSSTSTNSTSAEMHHKTMDENLLRKNVKNGLLDPQPLSNVKMFHTNKAREMPISDTLDSSFQHENEVDARHSPSTSYSSNPSNFEYRSQKVAAASENGLDSKLLQREEFNTTFDTTNMPEDSLKGDVKKTIFQSTNSSQNNTTNSTSSLSNLSIKKLFVGNKLELTQPASPKISQMKLADSVDGAMEKQEPAQPEIIDPKTSELNGPNNNNNSEKLYKSNLKKRSKYEKDSAVEFKTRSISTTASSVNPKHLDISVNYRNKSPHSHITNANMTSYRNTSYDPKTFPNVGKNTGGNRHNKANKTANMNGVGARNSSKQQQRSSNMVRYDNSARKFYIEEKNKSNGLSEKSR